MSSISAIVGGIAFVILAAINVVVMLEASHPSRNGATRTRLISSHHAVGYLFVILFCIMAYGMSQSARVHPRILRASSFCEPGGPGVKARDRVGCCRVPVPRGLGVAIKEEAIACFRGVIAYS